MLKAWAILAAAALSIPPLASGSEATPEPRARSWAVRLTLTQGTEADTLRIAESTSESGSSSLASSVPLAINGDAVARATATSDDPNDEQTMWTWTDDTGSATVEGGFAEAHVTDASAVARAGFGSMTGSGFALADELLTWDQQEQLMGQWMETNDALVGTVNAALEPLSPAAEALGLTLPTVDGISPVGFVDFLQARQVASKAETASSTTFTSARADTTLGELRMLGGFIDARGISARALSESTAGEDTRETHVAIEELRIAGFEVTADDDGLHVAGNDLVSRSVLQPLLDTLLGNLEAAGVHLRVLDTVEEDDLRSASAFQLEFSSGSGGFLLSIAHVEASAASVGGYPFPSTTTPAPAASSGTETPSTAASAERPLPRGEADVATPRALDGTPAEIAQPPPQPPADLRARPQPPEAVRAARTMYLLMAVGGLIASLGTAMLIRSPVAYASRRF